MISQRNLPSRPYAISCMNWYVPWSPALARLKTLRIWSCYDVRQEGDALHGKYVPLSASLALSSGVLASFRDEERCAHRPQV